MSTPNTKTSFPKSKIQIVLLESIHPVAEEILRQEGFQIKTIKKALSEAELLEHAQDAHLLGIRSKTQVSSHFFEKCPRLMSVGAFCIGTDQVDLKSAQRQGVPVFNAPYSNTRSVAELIICELIALSRQVVDRSQKAHLGEWIKSAEGSREVRGKILGIVGYGHIGSQLSILAEALGLQVVFYDIIKKLPLGNAKSQLSLNAVLSQSDFVSLHVPDTAETRGFIGAKELRQMKKGSCLLNASRGQVVDVEALANSLKEGHLAGAAVDVFPSEPQSNQDRFQSVLQGLPNVILTPHIGGSTEEAQESIGREVAASWIQFVNHGGTTGAVNFPKVELPLQKDVHRVLNVHRNVPGVLRDINNIVSELGANIRGQFLGTDSEIGYLVMDVERAEADPLAEKIRLLSTSIKTRVLY